MNREPTWLSEYKRNVYSQTGEDGVIEKILEILPQNDKWCVEFGAWDGMFCTNTRHLIESRGFSSVLIELSKKRFIDLQRNYAHLNNVYTINRFVGFTPADNLDTILKNTPIPIDFDFLSIDIDGNDYHVWKAFSEYRPKVVVVEFNSTFPSHVEFIQPADPSVVQGSSLRAFVNLAKEKGYELVCVLSFNAFFVRKEYFPLFDINNNTPEVLQTDLSGITYLSSGYDGQIFLSGSCLLPWHDTPIRATKLQYLPKCLRRFPGDYSFARKILFALWLLKDDPSRLLKETRTRFGRLFARNNP